MCTWKEKVQKDWYVLQSHLKGVNHKNTTEERDLVVSHDWQTHAVWFRFSPETNCHGVKFPAETQVWRGPAVMCLQQRGFEKPTPPPPLSVLPPTSHLSQHEETNGAAEYICRCLYLHNSASVCYVWSSISAPITRKTSFLRKIVLVFVVFFGRSIKKSERSGQTNNSAFHSRHMPFRVELSDKLQTILYARFAKCTCSFHQSTLLHYNRLWQKHTVAETC